MSRVMAVEACPECGAWLGGTRSHEQNAKLHAMLTEISRTQKWAGQKMSVEDWKRLFTAAHCRAQKESARLVPALDGQGFDVLYRRTSKMSKSEMVLLIDYVDWWCAENGVELAA